MSNKQTGFYNRQESLHRRKFEAFRKNKEKKGKANGSILALVFTISSFDVA